MPWSEKSIGEVQFSPAPGLLAKEILHFILLKLDMNFLAIVVIDLHRPDWQLSEGLRILLRRADVCEGSLSDELVEFEVEASNDAIGLQVKHSALVIDCPEADVSEQNR